MSEDMIANLVLALQQHTILALFFVFLVAFSESLILIGLVVPGAILMVLFGALIAMDALEFWPTTFFAIIGAIAGDTLSYWLGKRYENSLLKVWPLSRHPEIIIQANQFFLQHGVKSIVLGRFIGLIRPVIPAIAGIARMPVKTFVATNVGSAIIWAPIYLLPGIVFGLSFEMAREFASKFIFLIFSLLTIIILSLWIIQRIYIFAKPYNDKAIIYLLDWGKKHSIAGEVPAAIFDKTHPELRGLSLVAVIIISGTLLFTFLQNTLPPHYNPFFYDFDSVDQFIYHSLQTFRSPPFDGIMLWLGFLSSSEFIALLCFSLGGLFLIKKNFLSLWHLLAAISLPLLLSPLLTNDLTRLLQQNLNIDFHSLSFIIIISTVGFLTVIIDSELSYKKQKIIYYFSASLVLFIMLAQLYFATQVFSQVIFGLFVGAIWFNLLGIAYRRHIKESSNNKTRKEILLVISLLLVYPSWKTVKQKNIYNPPENYFVMGTLSWLESGWTLLPNLREGIHKNKNNVFNLQWLGTDKHITSQLSKLGFESSLNTTRTLSNWFLDEVKIKQLPVLPHIHQGEYETLRFYRYSQENKELTVIRLWPSKYKLKQNSPLRPLWFGSMSIMTVKEKSGITYLVTTDKNIDELIFAETDLISYKKITLTSEENKNHIIFLLQ